MSPTLGEALDDPTSNDEHVAQLLSREARDKSLKYSALGLQAYLPRRPTDKAPKPNTRFLKNILRDTDNHNAALRKKEEEDARDRMQRLRGERSSTSRRLGRDGQDRNDRSRGRGHHREDSYSHRSRTDRSLDNGDGRRSRRHRRQHDDSETDADETPSRRHGHRRDEEDSRATRRRDSSRDLGRSSRSERDGHRHHHRRHRHPHRTRSRSPSRSRSPRSSKRRKRDHDDDDDEYDREKTGAFSEPPSRRRGEDFTQATSDNHKADEESDPLEDLVGPLPRSSREQYNRSSFPSRGRGVYRADASNIDAHFAQDYDPNLDVHLEDDDVPSTTRSARRPVAGLMTEEDDWDIALEALRDRANWKQRGAERLKAAGFGEDVVEKWNGNPAFSGGAGAGTGVEGNIEDVRWAKKGEGREWDRGKTMNADGHYEVKAPW